MTHGFLEAGQTASSPLCHGPHQQSRHSRSASISRCSSSSHSNDASIEWMSRSGFFSKLRIDALTPCQPVHKARSSPRPKRYAQNQDEQSLIESAASTTQSTPSSTMRRVAGRNGAASSKAFPPTKAEAGSGELLRGDRVTSRMIMSGTTSAVRALSSGRRDRRRRCPGSTRNRSFSSGRYVDREWRGCQRHPLPRAFPPSAGVQEKTCGCAAASGQDGS